MPVFMPNNHTILATPFCISWYVFTCVLFENKCKVILTASVCPTAVRGAQRLTVYTSIGNKQDTVLTWTVWTTLKILLSWFSKYLSTKSKLEALVFARHLCMQVLVEVSSAVLVHFYPISQSLLTENVTQ